MAPGAVALKSKQWTSRPPSKLCDPRGAQLTRYKLLWLQIQGAPGMGGGYGDYDNPLRLASRLPESLSGEVSR